MSRVILIFCVLILCMATSCKQKTADHDDSASQPAQTAEDAAKVPDAKENLEAKDSVLTVKTNSVRE